jgi:chemotaxis family two-component system response regulator Rcp1
MFEFFRALFGTDFLPHLYGLRGEPAVLWLHVLSDLAIAAAYFAIPMMLFDVVEAMKFLLQAGHFAGSPRPDLTLLDQNLPRKDGRTVLTEAKKHPSLKTIPVLILTTSSSEGDMESSYLLHANSYIAKPLDSEGFLTVVKSIDDFWLSVVRLPPKENG